VLKYIKSKKRKTIKQLKCLFVSENYYLQFSKDIFVFVKFVIYIYNILINELNYFNFLCKNDRTNAH